MLNAMAPPRHHRPRPPPVETAADCNSNSDDGVSSIAAAPTTTTTTTSASVATTTTITTTVISETDPLSINDSGNNSSSSVSTASSSSASAAQMSSVSPSSSASSSSPSSSPSSTSSSPSSPVSTIHQVSGEHAACNDEHQLMTQQQERNSPEATAAATATTSHLSHSESLKNAIKCNVDDATATAEIEKESDSEIEATMTNSITAIESLPENGTAAAVATTTAKVDDEREVEIVESSETICNSNENNNDNNISNSEDLQQSLTDNSNNNSTTGSATTTTTTTVNHQTKTIPAPDAHQQRQSPAPTNPNTTQHNHYHNNSYQPVSRFSHQSHHNHSHHNHNHHNHNNHHHHNHNHSNHHPHHNHHNHNQQHNSNNNSNNNTSSSYAARSSNQRGHNSNHQHSLNHQQQKYHQQQQSYADQQQHDAAPTGANINVNAMSRSPQQHQQHQHVPPQPPPPQQQQQQLGEHNGPPHYVDLHVNPGECISLKLMDGLEQVVPGPATVKMISQLPNPPVPLPIQAPYGHMIHQVADENGILKHIILSVMDDENSSPHDYTVINFPQGPFRIDSQGQLVSINGASDTSVAPTTLPQQVYFANYDGCPIAYDTATSGGAAAGGGVARGPPPMVPDPGSAAAISMEPVVYSEPPVLAAANVPAQAASAAVVATAADPTAIGPNSAPVPAMIPPTHHQSPYHHHSIQQAATSAELSRPSGNNPYKQSQSHMSNAYQSPPMAGCAYASPPPPPPGPQAPIYAPAATGPYGHHHHAPSGITMANVVSANNNGISGKQHPAQQQQPQQLAYNRASAGYHPMDDQYHPAQRAGGYGASARHHEGPLSGGAGKDKSGRYQGSNVKVISNNQQLGVSNSSGSGNMTSQGPVSPHRPARGGSKGAHHHQHQQQQQQHINHSQWSGLSRNAHSYQPSSTAISIDAKQHDGKLNSTITDSARGNDHSSRQQSLKTYAYHAQTGAATMPPGAASNKQHMINPAIGNQQQAHYYVNGQIIGGNMHGGKSGSKSHQHNKSMAAAAASGNKQKINSCNHQEDGSVIIDDTADMVKPIDQHVKFINPRVYPDTYNNSLLQHNLADGADKSPASVISSALQVDQHSGEKDTTSRSSRGKQKKCQNQQVNKGPIVLQPCVSDRKSADRNNEDNNNSTASNRSCARAGSLTKKQQHRLESPASNNDNRSNSSATLSANDKTISSSSAGKVPDNSKANNGKADKQQAVGTKQQSNEKQQQQGKNKKNRSSDKTRSSSVSKASGNDEQDKRAATLAAGPATSTKVRAESGKIPSKDSEVNRQSSSMQTSATCQAEVNDDISQQPGSGDNKTNGAQNRELTFTVPVDNNEISSEAMSSSKLLSYSGDRQDSVELPTSDSNDQIAFSAELSPTTTDKQRRGLVGKQGIKSDLSSPTAVRATKKASPARDLTSGEDTFNVECHVTHFEEEIHDEILVVSTNCDSNLGAKDRADILASAQASAITITMRTSLSENNIKSLHDKQLAGNLSSSVKSTQTTPSLVASSSNSGKSTASLSSSQSSSNVCGQELQASFQVGKKKATPEKRKSGTKSSTTVVIASPVGKKHTSRHIRNSLDTASSDTTNGHTTAIGHQISNSTLLGSPPSTSTGYRQQNNHNNSSSSASSHSSNSNHSNSGSSNSNGKTLSQPAIKYSFRQCRNKFASMLGKVVQNSLSSYSDTKFAGLLLVIFTIFAMLLAIFIHLYISE